MDPKLLKTFKELGDLYQILGIEPTENKKLIKKAYKDQAKVIHPDKSDDPNAKEKFHNLKTAYDILMDTDLKAKFDKYKENQKYHVERTANQNKERRKFADELFAKEKASKEASEAEKKTELSKEERKREEGKRMKKEWEEEEQKRREELEKKKKVEKVESKQYTMVKVKWPKAGNITYTDDILKIIFGKYGEIKDVAVFPGERKALIEFQYRLSAEKAYDDNKPEAKEKMGFDDGLRVSLLVKEKEKSSDKSSGPNDLSLNSNNLQKISSIFNRDSKILLGSREEELRRIQERQKIIDEMLAKEGLSTK